MRQFFLVLLAAMACFSAARAAEWRVIAATAEPASLRYDGVAEAQTGALRFLGGLELRSSDSDFGGFSALHVSDDGETFLAVSDNGAWLRARLVYSDGRLTSAAHFEMAAMENQAGAPLARPHADAESLVFENGRALVGFERRHRIWAYAFTGDAIGLPSVVAAPARLARVPNNGGLEALARLSGGRLVAITERFRNEAGDLRGWIREGDQWSEISVATPNPFGITDAAQGPDGALYLLERHFSTLGGMRVNLLRVRAENIAPGARLDGERLARLDSRLRIDNFEGLSVRRDKQGRTLIYLISDDNFNAIQKTLLYMFEVME
ncbi:MAG: esterase-like activity of phytase family protein [Parvularculaceae bacterium]